MTRDIASERYFANQILVLDAGQIIEKKGGWRTMPKYSNYRDVS